MGASPAQSRRPITVAVVAPSLGILGGQAIQADRLVHAWSGDPDVSAWLVPINPVPPRLLRRALGVKYLRTLVTQFTYWPLLVRELRHADVVHVFSASYYAFLLASAPAVIVARLLGKPVVMNYHSGEAPDHLSRSAFARAMIAGVERNAVPSRFLQEVFARFCIEAEVIPNVIDTQRFPFRVRAPLGPNILSTRNFEDLYNVACTLRTFALVQQRFPDATLTLVGTGSAESALRTLASQLGLRHVRFEGRVPPEEIWRYYDAADVYLQTPDIDNMPLSILEAFCSGCPVVSTDAGGVPAILTSEVHGLLVKCGDHASAAAQILRLLEDPDLARRLAAQARETCERYRWDNVRPQWLSLYRSLARPSALPAPTTT